MLQLPLPNLSFRLSGLLTIQQLEIADLKGPHMQGDIFHGVISGTEEAACSLGPIGIVKRHRLGSWGYKRDIWFSAYDLRKGSER